MHICIPVNQTFAGVMAPLLETAFAEVKKLWYFRVSKQTYISNQPPYNIRTCLILLKGSNSKQHKHKFILQWICLKLTGNHLLLFIKKTTNSTSWPQFYIWSTMLFFKDIATGISFGINGQDFACFYRQMFGIFSVVAFEALPNASHCASFTKANILIVSI